MPNRGYSFSVATGCSATAASLPAQEGDEVGRQGVPALGLEPQDGRRVRRDEAKGAEPAVVPEKVARPEEAAPDKELVGFALGPLLQQRHCAPQPARQIVPAVRCILRKLRTGGQDKDIDHTRWELLQLGAERA